MKIKIYVALMVLIFTSCSSEDNLKSIGFMQNVKVFEEFEMKKDYDKIMEDEMKNETGLLDSLAILLKGNFDQQDSLSTFKLRKDYYVAEQLYNTKFEQLSTKYTTEVNNRLNTYIEEFSKEKGYIFILGSGGQGNVMYVDETHDITEELIKYANNKYSN